MTAPSGDAFGAAVAAILDKIRQELLWRLRPATVTHPGPANTVDQVRAIYDGDTAPVRMTSLIGVVPAGTRVMVIFVPPSGNYLIGYAGLPPA